VGGTPWRWGLLAAAQEEFDTLLTLDGSLEFQQNLSKFRIAVIVVHVPKNQLAHYRVLHKELIQAVESTGAGQVIHIRAPSAARD